MIGITSAGSKFLGLSIIISAVLCFGCDAKAQLPEELSSMPEQWQLTLDVIKSKAQTLLVENNGLQVEYRQLIGQVQKLQRSVEGQRSKNDELGRFLNERHGQTEQQVRIGELDQGIKLKAQKVRDDEQQLAELNRKHPLSGFKAQPLPDADLPQLRKELEDESRQEVLLENELGALRSGGDTSNLDAAAIDAQNQQLQARLDNLRLQKLQHERRSSGSILSPANKGRYAQLKERKERLESEIYAYESRMDGLRQAYLTALSGPVDKKKLVHEMVRLDARNNKMKEQIKSLQEDIDVLKDQVARLERRVNFAQGKDTQQ